MRPCTCFWMVADRGHSNLTLRAQALVQFQKLRRRLYSRWLSPGGIVVSLNKLLSVALYFSLLTSLGEGHQRLHGASEAVMVLHQLTHPLGQAWTSVWKESVRLTTSLLFISIAYFHRLIIYVYKLSCGRWLSIRFWPLCANHSADFHVINTSDSTTACKRAEALCTHYLATVHT